MIVLLYGSKYWNEIVNFKALARHGMIEETDLDLFRLVDSPTEALEILKQRLVTGMDATTPAIASSTTPSERGAS
jgi:predicted Rossmann-fold nucleotide-binding protein